MNVESEIAAANRRIQRGIERNALIALARIEGITPQEYAAKVDAERAAAAQTAFVSGAVALGRQLRAMSDSWKQAMEGIARGFNGGAP